MNAAAKSLSQGVWFRGDIKKLSFSKDTLLACMLIIMVLISALTVVYTKNLQRVYFSEGQILHKQTNHLHLEWGQLLLEQSTLATPARVQAIAQKQLAMVLPISKQVIVVKSRWK